MFPVLLLSGHLASCFLHAFAQMEGCSSVCGHSTGADLANGMVVHILDVLMSTRLQANTVRCCVCAAHHHPHSPAILLPQHLTRHATKHVRVQIAPTFCAQGRPLSYYDTRCPLYFCDLLACKWRHSSVVSNASTQIAVIDTIVGKIQVGSCGIFSFMMMSGKTMQSLANQLMSAV